MRLNEVADYSNQILRQTDPGEVSRRFGEVVRREFGAKYFILTESEFAAETQALVLATNTPVGFTASYAAKGLRRLAPILSEVRVEKEGFFWNPDARSAVLDAESAVGFTAASMLPVHRFGGWNASALAMDEPIESAEERASLQLLTVYTFEAVRRIQESPRRIQPVLTPRERECLAWLAEGKSAWDVSQILGISEATVRDYTKSLRRKYNSETVVQVVVKAVLDGTLAPTPAAPYRRRR